MMARRRPAGYCVTVEVAAQPPVAAGDDEIVDRLGDLLDKLAGHHGAVAGDRSGWSATVTVDADDPLTAVTRAADLVVYAAVESRLPSEPVTRLEAVREDVRDAHLSQPVIPPLVTGAQAARMLGVSRQRLHELARTNPEFPQPLVDTGGVKMYGQAAVEQFARRWQRRAGRPPKLTG